MELLPLCGNEKPCCVRLKKKKEKTKKKTDPKKVFKGLTRMPKVKIKQSKVSAEAILGRVWKK